MGEGANLQEEVGILASVDEENWRKGADRICKNLPVGDLNKVMHCLSVLFLILVETEGM